MKTVIDIEGPELDKYAGRYEGEGEVIAMKREGDRLMVSPYPGIWVNAFFTSDTDFFVREFRGDLKFVTDEGGKVTGFIINGMTISKAD
jgi:hypothetical protein